MMNGLIIKRSIVFHCQYVYGIGHFVRTIELARGLSEYFNVFIFNGGEAVPNFDIPLNIKLIQLPAVFKDENCNSLLPVDTSVSIEECFLERKLMIEKAIEEIKPDVLITEHFPFGLLFADEVNNLIFIVRQNKESAKIVASVRDIIEAKGGSLNDVNTLIIINKWYDLVLVHGDENYIQLKDSFPQIDRINVKIVHTGYIVRAIPASVKSVDDSKFILASIAGGRMGSELLDVLIDCHLYIRSKIKHKLVLFSGAFQNDYEKQFDKVNRLNSNDIVFNLFNRRKYIEYLSTADLVISLGGYNSIIESIAASRNLLVYKRGFSGGNTEQDLRIEIFEKLGVLKVVNSNDLNTKILNDNIINALNNTNVPKLNLNIEGVQNSIKHILNLVNSKIVVK